MYKMEEKKMEVTEKMTEFQLEKAATLKTIAIRAKKVGEMVDFYKKVMGFVLKSEENNLSIWGTREAGTQLLILEETRKAEDFHNEEKQMAYFSIKVPTEKEFLQIAQRVLEQDYPIDESFQIGTRQSMFITDLEGNQFEIFHDEATANSTSEKQPIVLKDLISEDLEPHQGLAAGSYLAHVQLKTNNQKEIKAYYEEVLGLKRNEKDQFVLEDGKATIGFQKPETSEVDQLPDPHLGLDFFTIKLSDQDHILAIEQQLTAKNQEFFIDQKKAIVTVFDPIGLEWWFVLK
ncbi:TPA: VOC family protein [Enterococcus faecalis]|nr:VOC family protein [Enterococcus faecalis]